MDLPMVGVPIDETLHIERNGSEGHVFHGGDIVAPGRLRSAPALGQPVLIELDVDLPARGPQSENVAHAVAVQFAIRIHGAAIDSSEPMRTVGVVQDIRIQINPMNLDKGRDALAGYVRDVARREELPLVRNAASATRCEPIACNPPTPLALRQTLSILRCCEKI